MFSYFIENISSRYYKDITIPNGIGRHKTLAFSGGLMPSFYFGERHPEIAPRPVKEGAHAYKQRGSRCH